MQDSLQFVDNHCHLDSLEASELEEVLQAAAAAGVKKMIDVSCDISESKSNLQRAEQHSNLFATVGVHPHAASGGIGGMQELLEQHGENPKLVAVGECGLDYYYDNSPRDQQREVFAQQIELAHRFELPLVIHTRDAWDETFAILQSETVPEKTIFHCFSGGPAEAERCLELGGWLSFSGIVSFKSAKDVAEAARMCPPDRYLLETDSPYLAPVPHRGKRNQPAFVKEVAVAFSTARSEPLDLVAQRSWENAHNVYQL